MKNKAVFCLVTILACVLVMPGRAENFSLYMKRTSERITESMPGTWFVAEKEHNAIPYGHYVGSNYDGPTGLSLTLQGDRDVVLNWKDSNEIWHEAALAKEALELWIMPYEYEQSWKRFLIIGRPTPAELICSSRSVRVYGLPSGRLTSETRFKELLSNAVETKWPKSPGKTGKLSWTNWKHDIRTALKDCK